MKAKKKQPQRPYISLRFNKKFTKCISVLLATIFISTTSCSYFTVKNVPTTQETVLEQIDEFNTTEKYVVIHSNNKSWHLKNVVINEDNKTLSGIMLPINAEHQYKKPRYSKKVHQYKSKKSKPYNELHLNLKTSYDYRFSEFVEISLSDIETISVNEKNTGRTVANVAIGTIGTVFAVTLIVFALKSSCPFVYIKNGEAFEFIGELYPGAITANMQRDDYLPLGHLTANGKNEYLIKITNQLKEIQHTDQVQLIVANHDKDLKVLLDSKGKIQTFKSILPPHKVVVDGMLNNREPALKKDNNYYAFNTAKTTKNSTRSVVFEFNKPKDQKMAKLYITTKNSVWLDYMYGKFNQQFGVYYNTFQKKQQSIPNDSIQKWIKGQNIPLSVHIKTDKEWQLVEHINTVGPLAMRDIAVPLELNNVFADKIQIKLETGFMFWDVDYIGIDFSENENVQIQHINPEKAIDQYGNDVLNLLLKSDKRYLIQPNIGDEVTIGFITKPLEENLTQSAFLKSRGYYNYIRNYKGFPDLDKLKSFRENNSFTQFSESTYFEFVNFDINTLAYHE